MEAFSIEIVLGSCHNTVESEALSSLLGRDDGFPWLLIFKHAR